MTYGITALVVGFNYDNKGNHLDSNNYDKIFMLNGLSNNQTDSLKQLKSIKNQSTLILITQTKYPISCKVFEE